MVTILDRTFPFLVRSGPFEQSSSSPTNRIRKNPSIKLRGVFRAGNAISAPIVVAALVGYSDDGYHRSRHSLIIVVRVLGSDGS